MFPNNRNCLLISDTRYSKFPCHSRLFDYLESNIEQRRVGPVGLSESNTTDERRCGGKMEEETKKMVWKGKIPVCFSLAEDGSGMGGVARERAAPEPCYVSVE